MLSCFSSGYDNKFRNIIKHIDLGETQRKLMLSRFLSEVNLYDKKARIAEFFYIFFSLIITIGSVVLPALLSIQNLDFSDDEEVDSKYRERVYWITWSLSLLISISNALIQLLSLNKQYTSYINVRENMSSEGWKYLGLCDDYNQGNHKNNFTRFIEKIEEIKNEQTKKESSFLNHTKNQKDKKKNEDFLIQEILSNLQLNQQANQSVNSADNHDSTPQPNQQANRSANSADNHDSTPQPNQQANQTADSSDNPQSNPVVNQLSTSQANQPSVRSTTITPI